MLLFLIQIYIFLIKINLNYFVGPGVSTLITPILIIYNFFFKWFYFLGVCFLKFLNYYFVFILNNKFLLKNLNFLIFLNVKFLHFCIIFCFIIEIRYFFPKELFFNILHNLTIIPFIGDLFKFYSSYENINISENINIELQTPSKVISKTLDKTEHNFLINYSSIRYLIISLYNSNTKAGFYSLYFSFMIPGCYTVIFDIKYPDRVGYLLKLAKKIFYNTIEEVKKKKSSLNEHSDMSFNDYFGAYIKGISDGIYSIYQHSTLTESFIFFGCCLLTSYGVYRFAIGFFFDFQKTTKEIVYLDFFDFSESEKLTESEKKKD